MKKAFSHEKEFLSCLSLLLFLLFSSSFSQKSTLVENQKISIEQLDSIKTCSQAIWSCDGKSLYYTSEGKLFSISYSELKKNQITDSSGFYGEPRMACRNDILAVQRKNKLSLINILKEGFIKEIQGDADSRWDITPNGDSIMFAGKGYIWSRISSKGQYATIKKSDAMFGINELYIDNKKVSEEAGIVWIFSPYGSPVEWSQDGERLYYLSAKTGWTKIWSMKKDGSDIRQETSGEGDDRDFRILKDGTILFVSNRTRRVEWQLWIQKKNEVKALFGKNGFVRGISVSPDEKKVSFLYSTPVRPEELLVLDMSANSLKQLTNNSSSRLTSNAVKPKVIKYKSAGHEVEGILFIPKDASESNPAAAVIKLHGGPSMHDGLSWKSLSQLMVLKGFAVLEINYTGSAGYGKNFEEADNRRIGHEDCDDVSEGARFLGSLPNIDKNRIGVYGSSYGGYLTNLVIGRYPRLFAAAVNWFGIADWNTLFTVPRLHPVVKYFFLDRLGYQKDNAELYRFASPVTYADSIMTPLLVVHGDTDFVVPYSQSVEFTEKLKKKNKPVEFITYHNEGHGWIRKETRTDALIKLLVWFNKYLNKKEEL